MTEQKRTAHAAALAHLETNAALGTFDTDVVEALSEHPEAVDRAEHQLTEACSATRSAALVLWMRWQAIPAPMDKHTTSKQLVRFDDWLCELADEHDLPFE